MNAHFHNTEPAARAKVTKPRPVSRIASKRLASLQALASPANASEELAALLLAHFEAWKVLEAHPAGRVIHVSDAQEAEVSILQDAEDAALVTLAGYAASGVHDLNAKGAYLRAYHLHVGLMGQGDALDALLTSMSTAKAPAKDAAIARAIPSFDLSSLNAQQLWNLYEGLMSARKALIDFENVDQFKSFYTEGPFQGAYDCTPNGEIAAGLVEWSNSQLDAVIAAMRGYQPATIDEVHTRAYVLVAWEAHCGGDLAAIAGMALQGVSHANLLNAAKRAA